jgi:Cof subfamily protein (haloacid dehalogenase superfamily)
VSDRLFIAIDLDGTLIDRDLTMSEADAGAIARAAAAGHVVCLASGRLLAASSPFARKLGLNGPVIALQGSVAYRSPDGDALFWEPLDPAMALQAYDDLWSRGMHLQLYYGDSLYLDRLTEQARAYLSLSRVAPVMVGDLRALLTTSPPPAPGPLKILAVGKPHEVEGTIADLGAAYGARAHVFRSLPEFLEVTAPAATKGQALRRVASWCGIDAEHTVAIGDSDNDVSMFAAAARSYAVANATPLAKAHAGRVVGPLGHGVAEALDEVLGDYVRQAR